MKSPLSLFALLAASFLFSRLAFASDSQSPTPAAKTRLAIVGLDHDHVWELLKYIAAEPEADLVAIADPHPNLVNEAKSQVPKTVRFYSDYVNMLDEAKPEAVFVTTANDRHLEILRECAKRHIHYSTEKPMATNAADAREMQRLCYGAEWALWLKGRPTRVYATTRKLKAGQHNNVDDDATIVLDYPDATVVVEASWDWPYNMDRAYVFGPKGSLLARRGDLFFRSASDQKTQPTPEGEPVTLSAVPHETSNPIAYFLDCIRNNKPVEDPLSSRLNVQVMEILDAARESARTGRAVELR